MANWCNANLFVLGHRDAVLQFSQRARARPRSIFKPDMLVGESQRLFSARIEIWTHGFYRKRYTFQVRSDDGRDHFSQISQGFEWLCFVLVYGDPSQDEFGAYFIRLGRSRKHSVTPETQAAVMTRHGAGGGADDDDGDDDESWRYWEASWELMGLAAAYWEPTVLKELQPDGPAKPGSARMG
jgi:hypothetical protein